MTESKISKEKNRIKNQSLQRKSIVDIFTNAGFVSIDSRYTKVKINGSESDFDSIFILENLIVFSEDTVIKNPNDHLRKKVEFFKHCLNNKEKTVQLLINEFSSFKKGSGTKYGINDFIFCMAYTSQTEIDDSYKKKYKEAIIINKRSIDYFTSLTKTIGKSSRFELLKFLKVDPDNIGVQRSGTSELKYNALVLPETPSGFPSGYQLVTFLVDPSTLIKQSYVLRKDGWLDDDYLYQRILIKDKLVNMRKYLSDEKRVFVNNIIITLPDDSTLLDDKGNIIKEMPGNAHKKKVHISIPSQPDNIGIIDGQHRIFSYYEGNDSNEKLISALRDKQHLLATGIIYPQGMTVAAKTRFEAKLFLEINDKQTRTNSALRQIIGTIVDPFSDVSIAKGVVNSLSRNGPLKGTLEQHYFDKGKLKTTSIVAYGVKHLVKLYGEDSLFSLWNKPNKNELKYKKDDELLEAYITYCTNEINNFLIGFRQNIDDDMWTLKRTKSRVLTSTTINGLIHCLRILVTNNKVGDLVYYTESFKVLPTSKEINNFKPDDFPYKSSHWKSLGEEIYKTCFLKKS